MRRTRKNSEVEQALDKLNPRQRKYVELLADGETKMDAALRAGYAETTAENAKGAIETPSVQEAFAALIRMTIPAHLIAERLREGIDAQKTEFAKFEGKITDQVDCVDFEQRRKYAELAAEFGMYHVSKVDVEGTLNLVLKNSVPRPIPPTNGHAA